MKVLVVCEHSGTVRDAFTSKGHDAMSCDLLPSETPGKHYQGDAVQFISQHRFDLIIAHPPCTYLASSGMHWTTRGYRDPELTEDALDFVLRIMQAPCNRICIENPIGVISTRIRKPDQIIQPYMFGEDASKSTCLWLKGLPNLVPTGYVEPRMVNGRPRWGNQTDSGQNKLAPSNDRWAKRSKTYHGIASAMVNQWGIL